MFQFVKISSRSHFSNILCFWVQKIRVLFQMSKLQTNVFRYHIYHYINTIHSPPKSLPLWATTPIAVSFCKSLSIVRGLTDRLSDMVLADADGDLRKNFTIRFCLFDSFDNTVSPTISPTLCILSLPPVSTISFNVIVVLSG